MIARRAGIHRCSGGLSRYACSRSQQRHYTLLEAFDFISSNRHAERNFADTPVCGSIMHSIIAHTLQTPTSFNLQPYKIIVIQSSECKELVSTAMSPGNDKHVLTSACTIIFAGDSDPARNTRKLMELETAHGAKPSYVSSLPSKITLLLGKGKLANRIRALGSHLMSPLSPSPIIRPDNEAWGGKNVGLAAMSFMLSATAHGLRTLPMEGFDERRLAAALDIPDGYSVPIMICVGHSNDPNDPLKAVFESNFPEKQHKPLKEGGTDKESKPERANSTAKRVILTKVRFDLKDMCYVDGFGKLARFSHW
mmetsp:Transcript_41894/g.83320  ORF Transcript_41894/g.83320 Transcript_41894/m.83320 type:complete len:309 (+) Transcript_41894:12-938(+)